MRGSRVIGIMRSLIAMLVPLMSMLGASAMSLDGEWTLTWRGDAPALPRTIPAMVPGNCELDLVRAGILPEPERGMNVRKLREWEGTIWEYSRRFVWTGGGARQILKFEGVDTFAEYYLNDVKLGESENMLVAHEFEVTGKLNRGENTLRVVIRSALYETQKYDFGELGNHMGFADSMPIRKAAYMGGWDIFPRAYVAGIWRSVKLEEIDPVTIDNVAWIFSEFSPDYSKCRARVTFRVKGPVGAYRWGNKVRFALAMDGRDRYSHEREFVAVHNSEWIWGIAAPELWWPKGMGGQKLYDARIEVVDAKGAVLAKDERKVGIRRIELIREDVDKVKGGGQFLFKVNGEPCYIRGSNWVPVDAFPSRQAARIVPALELFEDLNCNMVRIWGGGVYEPDEFYDWCDAHGLMVWQDFMTGCGIFPQDDRYAKLTEDEIRRVVIRLRNHPSIALWSGNNENDQFFRWCIEGENPRNPNDDRNSRKTIPNVLFEYDVTRPYLPSSPYFSPVVMAGKALPSEDHLWGAREYYKTDFYTNSPCWFASEMGYHGMPSRKSLERMMTKACIYPWKGKTAAFEKDIAKLDWNDEWRLKASDPYMKGGGGLWKRNDLMTNQVRLMFGGVDTDLDTFIAQSQFVQAEALKTFCELFRTRKFTRFNGLIWWNVIDGWPQLSDAVVDWYGEKKPAYQALKNSQRDQIVCIVDDHSVWAVNDALHDVKGTATLTDSASGRILLEKSFTIPRNGKTRIGEAEWKAGARGVIRIKAVLDGNPFENHFLYGEPPFDWKQLSAAVR